MVFLQGVPSNSASGNTINGNVAINNNLGCHHDTWHRARNLTRDEHMWHDHQAGGAGRALPRCSLIIDKLLEDMAEGFYLVLLARLGQPSPAEVCELFGLLIELNVPFAHAGESLDR